MAYISKMTEGLKYDSAQFPTVVVNDGSIGDIEQAKRWVSENQMALKKELSCTGAILFRGFPVDSAETYDTFFNAFGYTNFTYKESLSNAVRINHTEFVFTANEAPKHVEIYLHNEMAQTPIYPSIISLFCENAAEQGGATAICRSDQMYQKLMQLAPQQTQKLEQLGIKYTTMMPADDRPESGQGRSWLGTLGVDNKAEAETKLHKLGYSWQWLEDGSLAAQSCKLDAIKTLDGGRKVFFNQIIAAYRGWKGAFADPSKAFCFGDDSPITKDFLNIIVATSKQLAYELEWQDGDVAIVDNHLAMHGRMPYSGARKRKVLVVLGR